MNGNVQLAFIVVHKACDNINWEIIFSLVQATGIDFKNRKYKYMIYTKIKILKLQNRRKEQNTGVEIKVGGTLISMIRFVYGIARIAEGENDLQTVLIEMRIAVQSIK